MLSPGIHGVHFGCGTVDKRIGPHSLRLLQKSLHPQHIGLKSPVHMIEMFRVDHCRAVYVDHPAHFRLLTDHVPKHFHLLPVIDVKLIKGKPLVFQNVLHRRDRRRKKIVKANDSVSAGHQLSGQFVSCHSCNAADHI